MAYLINSPAAPTEYQGVHTKKSVELTFVHPTEGCGKTQSEMNDTIPHTVVDMGYQGAERTYPHESTRSECCSVSSIRLENYHIFSRGLAKNTFTICNVMQSKLRNPTNLQTKIRKNKTKMNNKMNNILPERNRKDSHCTPGFLGYNANGQIGLEGAASRRLKHPASRYLKIKHLRKFRECFFVYREHQGTQTILCFSLYNLFRLTLAELIDKTSSPLSHHYFLTQ